MIRSCCFGSACSVQSDFFSRLFSGPLIFQCASTARPAIVFHLPFTRCLLKWKTWVSDDEIMTAPLYSLEPSDDCITTLQNLVSSAEIKNT
jgi:hypothetical protein